MSKKPNPEKIDSDNPEWTVQDLKTAMPFSGLPAALQTKLRGRGPSFSNRWGRLADAH